MFKISIRVPQGAIVASALLLSFILGSTAHAQQRTVTYWSSGTGRKSCGAMLGAKRDLTPNTNLQTTINGRVFFSDSANYDDWIFGFIAAINVQTAYANVKRPDIKVDNEGVLTWIEYWCRQNPASTVQEATMAFVESQVGPLAASNPK